MGVVSKIELQLFNLIRSNSPPDLSITEEIFRVLNISTNRCIAEWVIKRSTLISGVSEKERLRFFRILRKKISSKKQALAK